MESDYWGLKGTLIDLEVRNARLTVQICAEEINNKNAKRETRE